ncbi:MAG TPA: DUF5678 domain-containing protein [Candidatus Bathyarchaeia archaeon]|nr:DUF5678 domain-containing protein [Candidatus Bathyarchaeia archaeon]
MQRASLLIKKYDKLISQYPGRWVAVSNNKVIADSESIEELTQKKRQLNDVLVAYSPTPSEKKIGYLL